MAEETAPFYLEGNFAPVAEEVTALDLPVQGSVPEELRGCYVRNGPNPRSGSSEHWFVGDGMLHGIELGDGSARWYRNRWVRTKAFTGDGQLVGPDGKIDFSVGVANTHVVPHAGRRFALVESSLPMEVDAELGTVGVYDFGGKLDGSMTAHPKLCPTTGELHFFGYSFFPPYLTYHVADASGALVHSEVIEVSGPTMIHDFNITASRVVFMDLPVVFDLEMAMSGTMPYKWDASYGARLGVLPRMGTNEQVTWYEIDPCYVFHPVNSFDDGDAIVIDVPRYDQLWATSPDEFDPASMWRWRIDPTAGKVSSQQLDDRNVEFPRVDPRRVGLPFRYHYDLLTDNTNSITFGAPVKYDREDGSMQVHEMGEGRIPGESVFVPSVDGTAEDDGWLMTYVYDKARDGSDFVILDARDLTQPPVAVIPLPQRVPFGFHGSWFPTR